MTEHEQVQQLISRMLDEDLNEQEQAAVAEHLQVCAECRKLYDAFSALSGALREDLEDVPEELHEAIMADIRREDLRRKNLRLRRRWTGFVAVAAVLVLVITVSPRLLYGSSVQKSTLRASAAHSDTAAAAAEETAAGSADLAAAEEAEYVPELAENANSYAAAEAPRMMLDAEAAEADAPLSLDALLELLDGQAADLSPDLLTTEPEYLILTDEGALALYRYEGSLFFVDPRSGDVCRLGCSEESLAQFLDA